MDLGLILAKEYADKLWTLIGNDYEDLEWKDSSPKPTLEDLEALWPGVQLSSSKHKIDELRRLEYQKVSDPLFFAYQRGEATEQEWLDAVQAVKDKYPNPYSASSQA
jgi:hypothetical protein